jgi:hypothetical protein
MSALITLIALVALHFRVKEPRNRIVEIAAASASGENPDGEMA